jgi:hypothetical protein
MSAARIARDDNLLTCRRHPGAGTWWRSDIPAWDAQARMIRVGRGLVDAIDFLIHVGDEAHEADQLSDEDQERLAQLLSDVRVFAFASSSAVGECTSAVGGSVPSPQHPSKNRLRAEKSAPGRIASGMEI